MQTTMQNTTIKTPLAEISGIAGGLTRVEYTESSIADMELAKAHIQTIKEKVYEGEALKALSDLRNVKKLSREIRSYFSSDEVTDMLSASALLIKPGLSMVIGSFLLRFNRLGYPVKLFSNEAKAIKWLKEQE